MKIGIVGYGEIGSSLCKVYESHGGFDIEVVDPRLGMHGDLRGCEILNICIPHVEGFVEIVKAYMGENSPSLTVIHSTVAPGTTASIPGRVCHSPVRGLHPNLDTGIKTFVKYIGSEDRSAAEAYAGHLADMGIRSHICKDSKTTEYAKLLDTTYYGVCIAFHADVLRLCERENIEFDEVMTIYNSTYNEGYTALGRPNVVRPVLFGTRKIGGHCVVPNAVILRRFMDSPLVEHIVHYG
jgi:UDP-N-acetyl-D-mannosaminuronate dehydrogenase